MKPNNSKNNKLFNRNAVLSMLALNAPISRIELANRSGLSKMSLTNKINEFSELGYIKEAGVDHSSLGKKKPILLELNDKCVCAVGINITRSYLEGCVCDIKGNTITTRRLDFNASLTSELLVKYIISMVSDLIETADVTISGIGISCIGPLDLQKGKILNPTNFYNISNLDIVIPVKAKFNLPVYLRRNNDCAILAEKFYGIARGINNVVFLGISEGVGASAIINDKLIVGANGLSCEIGHTTIDINGEKCKCGNHGCLELYANTDKVISSAKDCFESGTKVTFKDVVNAAEEGNSLCKEVIDSFIKYVSIAITNLVKVYDPSLVVLGNTITSGGDELLNAIKKEVALNCEFSNIDYSKFKENAPLMGASAAVFDHKFFRNAK